MSTLPPIELHDVKKQGAAKKPDDNIKEHATEDGINSALHEDGYGSTTGREDFNAPLGSNQIVPGDQPRLIDPSKVRNSVFIERPPPKCNNRLTCIVALIVVLIVLIVGWIVAYLIISSSDDEEERPPWEPKITGVIDFG